MISTVADLLRDLLSKQAQLIGEDPITHRPTIGGMYEGLTRDILDRAIPPHFKLRVVDGFVEDDEGNLSQQIDAMIVTGEGKSIPFTTSFRWHIKDVIAAFEVKKNLYGADLRDGVKKLQSVNQMHTALASKGYLADINPTRQAFAKVTGIYPTDSNSVAQLPHELASIYHFMVMEQVAPIRVIFGYGGYVDEFGLREGLVDFLESSVADGKRLGVLSLPSLIICGSNSILKMNGHPYLAPMVGRWWPLFASNNENPLRLLIELIWTRLSNQFRRQFPMDDTLKLERMARFLSVKVTKLAQSTGWELNYDSFNREALDDRPTREWEPGEASVAEMVLIMSASEKGEIDLADPDLQEWARKDGVDCDTLVAGLVERRIMAWTGDRKARLIDPTIVMSFLPSGRSLATGDPEMAGVWLGEKYPNRKIGIIS